MLPDHFWIHLKQWIFRHLETVSVALGLHVVVEFYMNNTKTYSTNISNNVVSVPLVYYCSRSSESDRFPGNSWTTRMPRQQLLTEGQPPQDFPGKFPRRVAATPHVIRLWLTLSLIFLQCFKGHGLKLYIIGKIKPLPTCLHIRFCLFVRVSVCT